MFALLALASAACYGAADFLGGLTSKRASTLAIVVVSQLAGLLLLLVTFPFLPVASPDRMDFVWGAVAGLTGGTGVALLYRALAIGVMAVVAPTTAVCAVVIPVLVAIGLGERPGVVTIGGPDFGILGEGYLRLSYANSTENILKALDRMGNFLATRKAA